MAQKSESRIIPVTGRQKENRGSYAQMQKQKLPPAVEIWIKNNHQNRGGQQIPQGHHIGWKQKFQLFWHGGNMS